MKKQNTTHNGATTISFIILILGLAIAYTLNEFWYGALLAVGLALALRQYFLKNIFDSIITFSIFVSLFFTYRFNFFSEIQISAPILLGALAIFLLLREAIFVRGEIKNAQPPAETKTKS